MLISIMKNPVLYTIYEYDTNLFITMFCENKDRPQLECEGKCYLSKIQKEQNKKDATNVLKQLQTEIAYYNPIKPIYIIDNKLYFVDRTEQIAYYNKLYSFIFTFHLVKPPEVNSPS